jgi:hypothetical protein
MRGVQPARALFGIGTEALVVVGAYLLYSALRVVVEGTEGQAFEHAFRLASIEQALGLFHEESVQRAVERQPWLAATMEWVYLWAYLPVLGAAGLVVYFRDRALYRRYRNTMFCAAGVGLIIFAVAPVAPPRMLPEYGFLDPLHAPLATTSAAKNDFAAVPSFHFGFTLLAAVALAHVTGWRPWATVAASALPLVMLLAIVSTANHFFLDAAIGGAIVVAFWYVLVWSGGRRAAHRHDSRTNT